MSRVKQWIYLDKVRRKIFIKYEVKKVILNSLIKNNSLPFVYRYYALYNKSKISRYSSVVQQRNRCVLTGRVWNVTKKVQYSRFIFRTQAYAGNIPGCRRASW